MQNEHQKKQNRQRALRKVRLSRGGINALGKGNYPFPSVPPADQPEWQAQEVVLVSWLLYNTAVVDTTNSGVYTISDLDGYLNEDNTIQIENFAVDLSNAVASGDYFPGPSLAPYSCDTLGASDFAIANPCYVILLLEQNITWQFETDVPGITNQESNVQKYFDLNYVLPDSNSSSGVVDSDGYTLAYFSAAPSYMAYCNPGDLVNYFIQYDAGDGYVTQEIDPAIKNTGQTQKGPPPREPAGMGSQIRRRRTYLHPAWLRSRY